MRRLLAVLVLVGMFSYCTSAFGLVLVYKLNMSVKGIDLANNTDKEQSFPTKGYLVLTYDDFSGTLVDANLILYGKTKATNIDDTSGKVLVELDAVDDNTPGSLSVDSSFAGDFDILNISGSSPFGFEMQLLGKIKEKNIGTGTDEQLATSLKGCVLVTEGMLLNTGQDIVGSGSVKATLDTSATRNTNENNLTSEDVLTAVRVQKLGNYTEIFIDQN